MYRDTFLQFTVPSAFGGLGTLQKEDAFLCRYTCIWFTTNTLVPTLDCQETYLQTDVSGALTYYTTITS